QQSRGSSPHNRSMLRPSSPPFPLKLLSVYVVLSSLMNPVSRTVPLSHWPAAPAAFWIIRLLEKIIRLTALLHHFPQEGDQPSFQTVQKEQALFSELPPVPWILLSSAGIFCINSFDPEAFQCFFPISCILSYGPH